MTFWQNKKEDIYIKLYDDFASSLKTKQELAFYKHYFSKKQDIIEFGCGTGRTLVPLLEAGYKISGLDISGGMLKHLRRKLTQKKLQAQIYNKNLAGFSLNKKFDGAILSQRTLNFITSREEQRKALCNIAKTLKRGALLIINLMPARPEDFKSIQIKLKKTGQFKNSQTGKPVEYWENWIPNPMLQTWDMTNEFREGKKKMGTKMTMRIIFESELKYLLELCGFRTLDVFGDWKKSKYNTKATDLIIVAKKT